ncbi:MAG: hypothetical protein WA085_12695 [Sphingobium sp.]
MAVPGYTIAQLPMEEINIRTPEAYRADKASAIDSAVRKGQRPPGMAKSQTHTPTLDRVSSQMQARNAPKPAVGKIASFAKGGAALGMVAGAYDSLDDMGNGYREKFNQDMGVETPAGSVVADTARTLGNVGNAITFGLAGRAGQGISSAMNGGSFVDGFKRTPDRAQFLANQGQPGAAQAAQPAVATPAAAAPVAAPAAAAPTAGTTSVPSMPTIGKVNVSRQPNGVMSFSGQGQVQGYDGAEAGQLKGGSSSGAVTPADYQAAVARAAADKAKLSSLAISNINSGTAEGIDRAYQLAAGDPEAMAALEGARQQQTMRSAALNGNNGAASILNRQGDNAASLEETKLKIAADLAPKQESAYDQERARGAKADNDRAAITDGLLNQYLNAPDDKTRNSALEKMNALGGKNNADKYITVDVDTGQKDAVGNPIYAKMPFNTRTGQVASTGGAVGGQQQSGYPEGTKLNGPDGKAYVVKDGVPVLAS